MTSYHFDVDLLLPDPEYTEDFDFVDEDCKYIANYLYEGLNKTFYKPLKGNIVKTVRYFNDLFIPLTDFPVLKVYRRGYKDGIATEPQTSSTFIIAFALAYTQKSKVSSINSYVADEIIRLLKNGSYLELFQLDETEGMQVEFEDFLSPENVVYKYTTITVNIFTM